MAVLIASELSAPEVALATVTGVKLSKDLRFATFYISKTGAPDGAAAATTTDNADADAGANATTATDGAVASLRESSAFLRRRLSRVLDLRVTPEIRFLPDHTAVTGARLARLIEQAGDRDKG